MESISFCVGYLKVGNVMVKHDAHVKKFQQRRKNAKYYAANREKLAEHKAEYYASHREELAVYYAERRETNAEMIAAVRAKYRKANREQIAAYQAAYHKANPVYTLARNTLKRLHKGAKTGMKMNKASDIVGYTSAELRAHMETLFTEGMSWDNHGEWHIDHIKPVSVFKAEGITDVAVINALTNLQPLWARANQVKGASY